MFKWILYFLLTLPALAFAERSVSSFISNDSLRIGDSASIYYSFVLDNNDFVDLNPPFFDNPNIILRSFKIDSFINESSKTINLNISFSCFTNSNFTIPEKVFVVENSNNSSVILRTDSMPIHFIAISIDSGTGLKPLKGIMSYSKPNYMPYWLALAISLILGSILLYFFKRKPNKLINEYISLDKQISEFNNISINSKHDFEKFLMLFKTIYSTKFNINIESLTLSEINLLLHLNLNNELLNKIEFLRFSESNFDYQTFYTISETMKNFVSHIELKSNAKH